MKAQCAAMILAGGALVGIGSAADAQSQIPDATIVNIMRECAKIDDPTARLACYDNNVRAGGFDGRRPTVPGKGPAVVGGRAPNTRSGGRVSQAGAQGFGAEDVKSPKRFESYSQRGEGPDSITARVASVVQREPGIYLLTLEGGAQWIFTDSVAHDYLVPHRGDSIDISHASLGSFLMRFDNQQSVRVRRVK